MRLLVLRIDLEDLSIARGRFRSHPFAIVNLALHKKSLRIIGLSLTPALEQATCFQETIDVQVAVNHGLEDERCIGIVLLDPILAETSTSIHIPSFDTEQDTFAFGGLIAAALALIFVQSDFGLDKVTNATCDPCSQEQSLSIGRPNFQAELQVSDRLAMLILF